MVKSVDGKLIQPDERAITPKICLRALEILRSGKPHAYREVERLLGWESPIGMTCKEMARLLGVTYYHLCYLLERNYRQEKEKQMRAARKEAASMPGRIVTTQKLGFSLWLPDSWSVVNEDDSMIDLSEENQSRHKDWLSFLEHRELKKEYQCLRKRLGDAVVPFEEFVQNENREIEFRKQRWQGKLSMKMRQGFQVGYWSAVANEEENVPMVEVIKFHFREPVTSVELYRAEKPEQDDLLSGNRPKQTFAVDGMEAVRFYCIWREENNAQFGTFMTDGLAGWTIDCWSTVNNYFWLRPLFQRMVSSFHRL